MVNKAAIPKNKFSNIFNFKDFMAKGRSVMLLSAICTGCVGNLTAGVFYTGFLIGNDIDIVNLGIISFLPLIANCFSIFAPLILERFEKRRYILAFSRFLYYTINILGITLLPVFVKDQNAKVLGFAIIVFVANVINSLTAGAYPIWHLNFIPGNVRADYFSLQQRIQYLFMGLTLISSSALADALKNTPYEMTVIVAFRYAAYVVAILDVLILMIPHEFPYLKDVKKIKLQDVFSFPLKNGKYAATILVIALWTFTQNLSSSSLSYYLLNDVHVPYTFLNTIDAAYAIFLFALSPFWVKALKKWSWLKTFAITAMLHMPTTILYSFTTGENYIPIILIVRLTQHALGVGLNLAYANMSYINLPDKNQSVYMVFDTLVVALSGFCGTMVATIFISQTKGIVFPMFFGGFTNVQVLLFTQGIFQLLVGAFVLWRKDYLSPSLDATYN